MADRVGQQLGNYRLVRLLGQGGFAEVYLGEHVYLGTPAAIKVLHTLIASENTEHFHREARTIARLVHPHIVRVLDYGIEGMTPFLVEDYAPNGNLRTRHPRGVPLALPTVVEYVSQMADALQYAHEQKVIHRDVKPENMLLGRRNEILLSDFGIAVVAMTSSYNSTQGMQDMAGTVAYMAPEQIQAQAGPASDQYSLAVVTYELLCGERPFQGAFTEVAVKHTLVPPPSLREKLPLLSPEVEAVVMKALAKDPKQRFVDIKAFATALEEASRNASSTTTFLINHATPQEQISSANDTVLLSSQEGSPTALFTAPGETPHLPTKEELPGEPREQAVDTPGMETPAASMNTPILRQSETTALPTRAPGIRLSRRAVLVGLAGLAVLGATGAGVALFTHSPSVPVQPQATAVPSSGEGATLYTFRGHSGWVWSVDWSPNGSRVASASADSTAQAWDAESGDHLTVYSGHTDTVYAVSWSPDGKRVASAGYDKTVQVWDPTFGDHFYTYHGHKGWVWTVAWSPDGKHIASAGEDRTVQVWDAANGSHVNSYHGHTDYVHAVAWSPDGKRIASASGDGTVQVWDTGTGLRIYTYQPYYTSMWSAAWSRDGRRIASASDNKTAQVWDAADGAHLYIYAGHTDFVYAVAWSPNGEYIASGGDDKTVQIWSSADGTPIFTFKGHKGGVRSVNWSPDGKLVASGSFDETVRVWRAP
jgi:serine/threonine protein kinase/Tol biopolymer transport system component